MKRIRASIPTVLLYAFTSLTSQPVLWAETPDSFNEIIEARKTAMKNVGASLKAASQMLKQDFNMPLANALGRTLQSGAITFPHLFPEGSLGENSTATEDIWSDLERFNALALTLVESGTAMATSVDKASFSAAMKQAGSTCRSCHSTYRK